MRNCVQECPTIVLAFITKLKTVFFDQVFPFHLTAFILLSNLRGDMLSFYDLLIGEWVSIEVEDTVGGSVIY